MNINEKFEFALRLSARIHKEQTDRAGIPYMVHIIQVVSGVTSLEEKIVALLHDSVEDHPSEISIRDISSAFGEDIGRSVDCITKRDGESYSDYITRVGSDKWARNVKISDLIHNSDLSRLSNPTQRDIDRRRKYIDAICTLREINQ